MQGWVQARPGLSGGADRAQTARSLGNKGVPPGCGFLGPLWTWTDDPCYCRGGKDPSLPESSSPEDEEGSVTTFCDI